MIAVGDVVVDVDAGLDLLEVEAIWRRFGARLCLRLERGGPNKEADGDDAERAAHHLAAVVALDDDIADGFPDPGCADIVMGLAAAALLRKMSVSPYAVKRMVAGRRGSLGRGHDRFVKR